MGPDFYFSDVSEGQLDPVTSHHAHIRVCVTSLFLGNQKDAFLENIRHLFPNITNVEPELPRQVGVAITTVWVTEIVNGEPIKLEVKSMGAAFQKVFAAFTLLRSPAKRSSKRTIGFEEVLGKYFLLEEPEAFLYPAPENMSRLHSMLATKFTRIVDLKDPEFTPPTLIKDQPTQPVTFYWQLPSIESYLILHYFKNGMPVPGRLPKNTLPRNNSTSTLRLETTGPSTSLVSRRQWCV